MISPRFISHLSRQDQLRELNTACAVENEESCCDDILKLCLFCEFSPYESVKEKSFLRLSMLLKNYRMYFGTQEILRVLLVTFKLLGIGTENGVISPTQYPGSVNGEELRLIIFNVVFLCLKVFKDILTDLLLSMLHILLKNGCQDNFVKVSLFTHAKTTELIKNNLSLVPKEIFSLDFANFLSGFKTHRKAAIRRSAVITFTAVIHHFLLLQRPDIHSVYLMFMWSLIFDRSHSVRLIVRQNLEHFSKEYSRSGNNLLHTRFILLLNIVIGCYDCQESVLEFYRKEADILVESNHIADCFTFFNFQWKSQPVPAFFMKGILCYLKLLRHHKCQYEYPLLFKILCQLYVLIDVKDILSLETLQEVARNYGGILVPQSILKFHLCNTNEILVVSAILSGVEVASFNLLNHFSVKILEELQYNTFHDDYQTLAINVSVLVVTICNRICMYERVEETNQTLATTAIYNAGQLFLVILSLKIGHQRAKCLVNFSFKPEIFSNYDLFVIDSLISTLCFCICQTENPKVTFFENLLDKTAHKTLLDTSQIDNLYFTLFSVLIKYDGELSQRSHEFILSMCLEYVSKKDSNMHADYFALLVQNFHRYVSLFENWNSGVINLVYATFISELKHDLNVVDLVQAKLVIWGLCNLLESTDTALKLLATIEVAQVGLTVKRVLGRIDCRDAQLRYDSCSLLFALLNLSLYDKALMNYFKSNVEIIPLLLQNCDDCNDKVRMISLECLSFLPCLFSKTEKVAVQRSDQTLKSTFDHGLHYSPSVLNRDFLNIVGIQEKIFSKLILHMDDRNADIRLLSLQAFLNMLILTSIEGKREVLSCLQEKTNSVKNGCLEINFLLESIFNDFRR